MKRLLLLMVALLPLIGATAEAKVEKACIMSFNIRIQFPADTGKYNWESRKSGCVRAIKKHHPDILGLQEASTAQKAFIMKELPQYIMIDGSTKPGTLDESLEFGLNPIFFRADKFELLDYGTFWLNEDQTPGKKGWDAEYVRNANWVKLRLKKSGQIIFLFNTHLDNTGAIARQESAVVIVEKIKEIAGDNAVVFLTGDFNSNSDDKGIKSLTSFFLEAAKTVKKADATPSFNNFGRKGRKPDLIDHIFYRNARANDFKVADGTKYGIRYISDHYPVVSWFSVTVPKD